MLLHRREDTKVALHTMVVVITDVIFDHIDEFFFTGEAFAVVAFTLEDAPESLHWPVVNALGHTGHALLHAGFFQLVVESSVRILETSVTMKQRVCVGIGLYSPVKCLKDKRIVIPVSDHIGDNATVIEIQDRTEINLVHRNTLIPFELRNIGNPLFVGLVCFEFAVKKILGHILRVLRLACAPVVVVLYGGLDAFAPADSENALVVHMDVLIVPEIVVDAAITLVRALHVDLFYFLCYLLVFQCPGTLLAGCPAVVARPRNTQQLA